MKLKNRTTITTNTLEGLKVVEIIVRIYEVGISYYGRTYLEGKKIRWKDGFSAIYCILKYNIFFK